MDLNSLKMKLFYVMGGIRREGGDTYIYSLHYGQCREQDAGWGVGGWGLVRVSVVPDNFQFFYLIFFFSFKLI